MSKEVYLSADGIKEVIDPVDIHEELSAGFSKIENVIREESAQMARLIYDEFHNNHTTFCGVPIAEAVEVMRMYKLGELAHLKRR